MNTAFAYARVSTKDQEKQGNSIPKQFLRIEEFATSKKIQIIKTYQDSSSAYHDENREHSRFLFEFHDHFQRSYHS